MQESKRISKLFQDLFDGDPWIDVNIMSTLEAIDPKRAATKIAEGRNSIWEIVNHMTQWRRNVLERFKGDIIPSPEHNFFLPVEDQSEEAWQHSLKELRASQEAWINYLEKISEEEFLRVYPGNGGSYYYHIHGVLQHDAYHLGQIVLLTKLV